MVDNYINVSERAQAFHSLRDLEILCADSIEGLRRISSSLLKIGEASLALEIRKRIVKLSSTDLLLKLELIEARIAISHEAALNDIHALSKSFNFDCNNWEKVSYLFSQLGENDLAIRAVQKALALGGDEQNLRHRLAFLFVGTGQLRRGVRELRALFRMDSLIDQRLPALAQLAVRSGDTGLAVQFAEKNWVTNKSEPESTIVYAEVLAKSKEHLRAEILLTKFLDRFDSGGLLTANQWLRVARLFSCFENKQMERRAIAAGLESYPDDQELMKRRVSNSFIDRMALDKITTGMQKRSSKFNLALRVGVALGIAKGK